MVCWLGTWAQSWMAWVQIPPSHQPGDLCLTFLHLNIPIVKWSCALGIRRQVQHDLKGAIGLKKEGRRVGKKREGAQTLGKDCLSSNPSPHFLVCLSAPRE